MAKSIFRCKMPGASRMSRPTEAEKSERKNEIGKEYPVKKLKNLPLSTHWKIHLVSMVAGLLIGLVSSQFSQSIAGTVGMVAGFILILASFAWQILFVKCPHCGFHFHLKRPLSNHCPDCGEKLN